MPTQLAVELIKYLQNKPHIEVRNLIDSMTRMEVVSVSNPEEPVPTVANVVDKVEELKKKLEKTADKIKK